MNHRWNQAILRTLPFTLAIATASLSCSSQAKALDHSCYPDILTADMNQPHDGVLIGVPPHYDWAKGPRIGMGNNPGKDGQKFHAAVPLGSITETEGNQSTNTRVQLRNIRGYYLSKSQNKWILITQSESVGGSNFRADFKGNASFKADVRQEASGGLSVSLRHGEDTKHVFHFWGTSRGDIDPDDVAAAFASVEARLIVGDRTQPDDRDQAKYLVSAGMDYWKSKTAKWDHFKTNGDAFIGRKRLIGKDWTTLTANSLTPKQIQDNPPPFQGKFCQK